LGRGAQGSPWIFRQIEQFLEDGSLVPDPSASERYAVTRSHLEKLHSFYGDKRGSLYARKHVGGYVASLTGAKEFMTRFNAATEAQAQLDLTDAYFSELLSRGATETSGLAA
jgi:tRNA-dihydrouridine synthase B